VPFVKITQLRVETNPFYNSQLAYFYGERKIKPPHPSATQYGKPDQWLVTALFKDGNFRLNVLLEFRGEGLFAIIETPVFGHTVLIPAEELEIDPKSLRYAHDVETLKISYEAEQTAKKQAEQDARGRAELARLKAKYEP
jgi:hypothetical protein